MIKVAIDTGAVRDAIHWKTNQTEFISGIEKDKKISERLSSAEDFWELIDQEGLLFMYTSLVDHNVGKMRGSQAKGFWGKLKGHPSFEEIPIPLSRADGIHKADGSLLYGGTCGGSLAELLPDDHEQKYQNYPTRISSEPDHFEKEKLKKKYLEERHKEFDLEHLEAALEAEADYFITSDFKLLERLESVSPELREKEKIKKACEIACTASEALKRTDG